MVCLIYVLYDCLIFVLYLSYICLVLVDWPSDQPGRPPGLFVCLSISIFSAALLQTPPRGEVERCLHTWKVVYIPTIVFGFYLQSNSGLNAGWGETLWKKSTKMEPPEVGGGGQKYWLGPWEHFWTTGLMYTPIDWKSNCPLIFDQLH